MSRTLSASNMGANALVLSSPFPRKRGARSPAGRSENLAAKRSCLGPKCLAREPLLPRQRRYHCKRCRLDAKNARRYASADARVSNAAAVQRHRERLRSTDPLRRYLSDATRELVRIYSRAGKPLPRTAAMRILRIVEREVIEPGLVRQRVRALVRRARQRP